MNVTIIPKLAVEQPREWCEPQGCYDAAVWYGEVLLCFYSTDQDRLEPDRLNDEACRIIQQLTMALNPGAELVIEADELSERLGGDKRLVCYWGDFRPPLLLASPNKCQIPTN